MNKTEYVVSQSKKLSSLYLVEKKTTREIGKFFGVSKHIIENAMKIIGIEARKTKTKGIKPTREFLENAIFKENKPLSDISKELHCDPGAIKWWAREYGINIPKLNSWTQRNNQRGYSMPPKGVLENLYKQGWGLENIGIKFGVSRQAIVSAFNFYNIPIRISGWKHNLIICKDGHKVKSTYEQRVDDWLYENNIEHKYEPKLPFDNRGHADFLVKDIYIEIFGVIDSPKYNKRKEKKIELYKIHNCDLIIINHWDFDSHRNNSWQRKLYPLKSS